jgi:hypothetical protein
MEIADSFRLLGGRVESMMGERRTDQAALFYEFSLAVCGKTGKLRRLFLPPAELLG